MKTSLLLLDVAPDPVNAPFGIAGLILIGMIVLMLAAGGITGFVFLRRWLMSRNIPGISPDVSEGAAQPAQQFQPSSPNQP